MESDRSASLIRNLVLITKVVGTAVVAWSAYASWNISGIAERNMGTDQWLGEWWLISFVTPQNAFAYINQYQFYILIGISLIIISWILEWRFEDESL